MLAYAVVSEKLSPTSPLGDAVETFVRREDAERFIEESSATTRSSRPMGRTARQARTAPAWHDSRGLIRARGPTGGGRSRVLREHSLKQALEARARERGLSLTAAVVALLERGLDATEDERAREREREDASQQREQALIEAGSINALAFRYIGATRRGGSP